MKYLFVCFLLLFTGCNGVQEKIKNTIQTENAKHIRNNYKEIMELLVEYKIKLDKRNPKGYSKQLHELLKKSIRENNDEIVLYVQNATPLHGYVEYLNHAFEKNPNIDFRNDYLVIGLYKMFYEAFDMNNKHKITALSYDVAKMQKAYKNLQIAQWKIKFAKDSHNNYLFLTWQNNWHVELENKLTKSDLESFSLADLSYIKTKRETLLDPSNHSFEIITAKMLLYLESTLKLLNAEPEELGIEAIKRILFII